MSAPTVSTVPRAPVQRVIVGTAGHIDHGKTLLIKALTGTDCDRWAEEKARGITIDLGFASLVADHYQIGFIDVPGHHRFLHNALAGLGGVRIALLVVAATEGVMPQTREHLAICALLRIPSMVVALTKVDLASPDLLDLAELDVTDLLERTPFAGARIIRVSSVTGEGLSDLRAELLRQASQHFIVADPRAPVRLPVDRAFNLRGLGVVATGTLVSGIADMGATLELLPSGRTVRVRSIQVHGESRAEAMAGERTSLQLAGVELSEIERGMQLGTPGGLYLSRVACARFTLLESAPAPLKGSSDAHVFVYSTQALGRIRPLEPKTLEPGQSGLVELRFRGPVPVMTGDRFILRRPTPATTLGGGEILDPAWRRRRGVPPAEDLARLTSRKDLFLLWALRGGYRALTLRDFASRCGLPAHEAEAVLDQLRQEDRVRQVVSHGGQEQRWVPREAYNALKQRAVDVLEALFRRDRLAPGMVRAEFARRLFPRITGAFVQQGLTWLEDERCICVKGDLVTLPNRTVPLTDREARMVRILAERFRAGGLSPPTADELQAELGTDNEDVFQDALRYLSLTGILIRLPSQDLLDATVFQELVSRLRESGWQTFSVPLFKDTFGLTRRWAIPILEHCDAAGVTRREGQNRVILDPLQPHPP